VTICDNNPFTTLQGQALYEDLAKQNGLHPNDSSISTYAKLSVSSPLYSEETKKSYGFNLSQIHSCSFRSGQSQEPCNMSRDFHWIWMYDYGNCWQFNSDHKDIKETYNGIDFGLDLTVFPLEIQNKHLPLNSISDGLVVFVHNQSFSPVRTEKAHVFVETGKKTLIGVKRVFNFKEPYPYSQCIDLSDYSSDLYDLIKSKRQYRQQDCFKLCRQKSYIEKCGCNLFNDAININASVRFCSNSSDSVCWQEVYQNYNREECERKWCPLECDSVEYDLGLSSLVYPSMNSQRDSQYNMSSSATVRFVVFYSTLEYTFIKESPQTNKLDLFAKIGGTLGIFVGFSIFTLFEIAEILILVLRVLLF